MACAVSSTRAQRAQAGPHQQIAEHPHQGHDDAADAELQSAQPVEGRFQHRQRDRDDRLAVLVARLDDPPPGPSWPTDGNRQRTQMIGRIVLDSRDVRLEARVVVAHHDASPRAIRT